jgi:glutathione synthase/RimK-type ligase-like ATP-grasp enzyme
MKKILIISRRDNRPDYDQKDTYAKAMAQLTTKCEYAFGELEELVFIYDGRELHVYLDGQDIRTFDGLFLIGWFKTKVLEDIALSVAKYMGFHGNPVYNSEVLYTRSRSKLSQYVIAALGGINLTPFLFCKDENLYKEAFEKYWNAGYPVIMKGIQASRGNDNYLVQSEAEVDKTLALTDSEAGPWFVTQSFVPNDGDYRVIVMGDKVKYVIHRQSQNDSHLNNTSKGGAAAETHVDDLPVEIQRQCVALARLLRREITGVDMIKHRETGEFYLLEINNMPQMATGSLVDQKLRLLDAYFADTMAKRD